MDYNSKRWQWFRRNIPYKVRWFIGMPVFLVYLSANVIDGIIDAFKRSIDEYPPFNGGSDET